MKTPKPTTAIQYIASFPKDVQKKLQQLRSTIKKAAPKTEEVISYGIVGYKLNGMLIYFAGFKNHVSVYPAPRSSTGFREELKAYKGGKSTVQFPLDKTLPLDLIKRIVKFRIEQCEDKALLKKKK